MLNDRNKNFSCLVNKYIICTRVPLLAVHCNLYFDSHCHSLQFGYTLRAYNTSYACNKSFKDIKLTNNL